VSGIYYETFENYIVKDKIFFGFQLFYNIVYCLLLYKYFTWRCFKTTS